MQEVFKLMYNWVVELVSLKANKIQSPTVEIIVRNEPLLQILVLRY
jgi:hypothetical protein